MATAIERKLRLHPDFAASFGRQEVRDCNTAQAYFDAYDAWLRAHPDFDALDPLDLRIPPNPGPPPGPGPDWSQIDVEKIVNGDTSTTSQTVVRIETHQFDTDPEGGMPFDGVAGCCPIPTWPSVTSTRRITIRS